MPLTLYLHPLSSYCQKALIALYENGTPFDPQVVNFQDAEQSAAFKKMWPVRKFPVLRDGDQIVPESTSIIEYLARKYPGPVKLIPGDAEAAFAVRAQDRFYDLHVHSHMQRVIGERLRPAEGKDPFGLKQAQEALDTGLSIADERMKGKAWAVGETFSMADCAAAPALFYTNMVIAPLKGRYDNLDNYLRRLMQRPSYARALKEAEPFFQYVPR